MILHMKPDEQTALDAITDYYDGEISALMDMIITESPENLTRVLQESNRLYQECADAWGSKYIEFEDMRFARIQNSQKKILQSAKRQTNGIIKKIFRLINDYKVSAERNSNALEIDPANFTPRSDKEILSGVIAFPPAISEISKEIEAAAKYGDTSGLNPDIIIALIHKDLYRHYGKLIPEYTAELDQYITDAVHTAFSNEPEILTVIPEINTPIRIIKDDILTAFLKTAIKKYKILNIDEAGYMSIEIGGVKLDFGDRKSTIENIGVRAALLLLLASASYAANPQETRRTIQIPSSFFFLLTHTDTTSQYAIDKEVTRINHALIAIHATPVTMKSKYKGLPSFRNKSIFDESEANVDFIKIKLSSSYSEVLRKTRTQMMINGSIFSVDGDDPNSLAVRWKLLENGTMHNNVNSGQSGIISVAAILKEMNIKQYDEIDKKYRKSRWKKRIKEPFEKCMDKAAAAGTAEGGWKYCKAKSEPLTPQEEEKALQSYETWSELYISYKVGNQEFRKALQEAAANTKQRKIEAAKKREKKKKNDV